MAKGKFDQPMSMTQTDYDLVTWLTQLFGYNRSEVMRLAIRSFASQCRALEKDLEKRRGNAA